MKRLCYAGLLCFVTVLLSSCAAVPPPAPEPTLAKDVIKMRIKADPHLNMQDKKPHSLLVCVYQVKEKSTFDQLSSNEDGIYQLLDCEPYGDSVTAVKRLIVQPNQDLTVIMDRMEKTTGLGIAAGYFRLDKNRMTRLLDLPASAGSMDAKPQPLNLLINLGAQQIVGAEPQTEPLR